MSDVMMFGIAKMPYEMAMGDEMSRRQFYANTQRLIAALEAAREEVDALKAENERLRAAFEELLDALRQIAEWPDGGNRYGQDKIKRFAQAALSPAPEPRSTHGVWRDGEWLPCYCLAGCDHGIGSEQPVKRESPPLTFTQGVLCSLSILDGYGDSIAYREVANPHDPNQLWEEADEFDREHLARHGYRPRKEVSNDKP